MNKAADAAAAVSWLLEKELRRFCYSNTGEGMSSVTVMGECLRLRLPRSLLRLFSHSSASEREPCPRFSSP